MPVLRHRLERGVDGALLLCPTVRHRPPLPSEVTASAAAFGDINARTLRTTMLLSYLDMPRVSDPRGSGRKDDLGLLVSSPAGGRTSASSTLSRWSMTEHDFCGWNRWLSATLLVHAFTPPAPSEHVGRFF